MPDPAPYELLDFGNGRKLERFGEICLDRPAAAAETARPRWPGRWAEAAARFALGSDERGVWQATAEVPASWSVGCDGFQLQLKLTPFGHVGMFPEQLPNWRWIARQLARQPRPLRVLNLFAYTGGSTLAAAAAGAEVVHVDAARNVVQWARQNAQASGLQQAPVRWIVEDARRFVARQLRQGQQYHALILDPPSYGHGPKGEAWKLSSHLLPLLADCRRLLSDDPAFVLLTAHSPGFGPAELGACLQESMFGRCASGVAARPLRLRTADGRTLRAGTVARWPER
jgi:23S rRNA (cytosine1962-C5)-methyltransferase